MRRPLSLTQLASASSLAVLCAFAAHGSLLAGCSSEGDVSSQPGETPAESGAPAPPVATAAVIDAAAPGSDGDAGATADAAPLDVPASLVKALSTKPYVEESCVTTTYPGWPHPAQKCTYQNGLVVTVADPEPERVARWIVEASSLIPALDTLKNRDRVSWEAGLAIIAKHTLGQSSRIFPLDGQVAEDGTTYKFERGVTKTCSSGCYCRINSTSRHQWCAYAANVLKTEVESTCLDTYGQTTKTLTEPWLAHCFDNHVAAWTADRNEHYRAQAWSANQTIAAKIPVPNAATAADVLTALKAEYQ